MEQNLASADTQAKGTNGKAGRSQKSLQLKPFSHPVRGWLRGRLLPAPLVSIKSGCNVPPWRRQPSPWALISGRDWVREGGGGGYPRLVTAPNGNSLRRTSRWLPPGQAAPLAPGPQVGGSGGSAARQRHLEAPPARDPAGFPDPGTPPGAPKVLGSQI